MGLEWGMVMPLEQMHGEEEGMQRGWGGGSSERAGLTNGVHVLGKGTKYALSLFFLNPENLIPPPLPSSHSPLEFFPLRTAQRGGAAPEVQRAHTLPLL